MGLIVQSEFTKYRWPSPQRTSQHTSSCRDHFWDANAHKSAQQLPLNDQINDTFRKKKTKKKSPCKKVFWPTSLQGRPPMVYYTSCSPIHTNHNRTKVITQLTLSDKKLIVNLQTGHCHIFIQLVSESNQQLVILSFIVSPSVLF